MTSPEELDQLRRRAARERAARLESEQIAERVTRELYDEQQDLTLLRQIAIVANETDSIEDATLLTLKRVCQHAEWPLGHFYMKVSEDSGRLSSSRLWHSESKADYSAFKQFSEETVFTPGLGLPGRVLESGKPLWLRNAQDDAQFPRARAAAAVGLRAAFAVPVLAGGKIAGVLEFFSEREQEPQQRILETMTIVGAQLGRVFERRHSRSALEWSEQYFRRLTENALDLITVLNADGTIRYESPAIRKVLGYPPEEYIGRNAFEFVHPDDVPGVQSAFVEALRSQGNTPVLTFRFRHRDGSWRLLEGRGNNLLNDPFVAGIVFNSHDVTERKKLEEQFFQSQKVQAIGQLAGGVAHDFNNLLTAIINYNDLLLKNISVDSADYVYAREVGKAADRAAGLTRQLLAFSRKQILQPRVVSLNEIVADMGMMLRRLLGETIDLVSILTPDVGPVKVDPGQIEQVIMNLAVNARDAMDGKGKLALETSNVTLDAAYTAGRTDVSPGQYVLLAVTDNGKGIPPVVRARLFEPFFTTKEVGKGTGLGLATCHGIIKQSGGHINVYSEVGKGTTFKIYLPRVQEAVEPLRKTETHVHAAGAGETLLLVEDEEILRDVGCVVLEGLGYRVLTAPNGKEALKMIENQNADFDLIVTDVVMPEMGGNELAERIRQLKPAMKILFTSGYTEDGIVHAGILEAGVAFIQKPYTAGALATKIRDMLDGKLP